MHPLRHWQWLDFQSSEESLPLCYSMSFFNTYQPIYNQQIAVFDASCRRQAQESDPSALCTACNINKFKLQKMQ